MECPTRSLTLPVLICASRVQRVCLADSPALTNLFSRLTALSGQARHPSRAALLSDPAMSALPVRAAYSTHRYIEGAPSFEFLLTSDIQHLTSIYG
jgi:hypothetical protein